MEEDLQMFLCILLHEEGGNNVQTGYVALACFDDGEVDVLEYFPHQAYNNDSIVAAIVEAQKHAQCEYGEWAGPLFVGDPYDVRKDDPKFEGHSIGGGDGNG